MDVYMHLHAWVFECVSVLTYKYMNVCVPLSELARLLLVRTSHA